MKIKAFKSKMIFILVSDQVLAVDPNYIFASNSKQLASSEVTTNMTDRQRNGSAAGLPPEQRQLSQQGPQPPLFQR